MKMTRWSKAILGTLLGGLILFHPGVDLPKLFYTNLTASIPRGLYLVIPCTTLRDGDIVAYRPTDATFCYAKEKGYGPKPLNPEYLLIKKIGALPRETYQVVQGTDDFYANGQFIGQAQKHDPMGNELPVQYGTHTVPQDSFLPIGTNPLSFDGRYEGTVPMDHILARVVPILLID